MCRLYFVYERKGNPSMKFLMVIMASGIARGRVRTTTTTTTATTEYATWRPYSKYKVDRDMQPWFTVYFFDIAHPCYDQLTPVKSRYPLTSITSPYRGLKCTAHRGHVFFWNWPLTKCWLSIRSRAHIRLTCWSKAGLFGSLSTLAQD